MSEKMPDSVSAPLSPTPLSTAPENLDKDRPSLLAGAPYSSEVAPLFAASLARMAEDDKPAARVAWQVAQAAARALAEWGADEAMQFTPYLHKFVCLGWPGMQSVGQIVTQDVANRAGKLCENYARIVPDGGQSRRGHTRAQRRVGYFHAAYHDADLALVATALLLAQIEQRRSEPGHVGTGALEDARLILCPLLDMLGMQALRETIFQTFWPQEEDPAGVAAAQALCDDVCSTLPMLLPGVACQRRFPCGEGSLLARRPAPRPALSVDIAVCVPTVEDCYRVLYHLHQHYALVEGSFADHLRLGRINGWRALHTAVSVGTHGDRARVNFQIYAASMEAVNRWGLTAWRRTKSPEVSPPNAWWNQAEQGLRQIELAPAGALPETLHVFSPQGQLFRFHRGCTVVDFAYHVHTELADQCRRFYINDEQVEPNAVLHHLDIVALEHDPQATGPTPLWLSAAHTSRARSAIERFLNRRGRGMDQGRRILDERRKHLEQHYGFNLPEHRLTQALTSGLRELRLARPEELLDELAAGRMAADQILHPLFAEEIARQIQLPRTLRLRAHQLQISQCCRPRPGEDIVGLVTRRHEHITRLRIHCRNCARVRADHEQVPLTWRFRPRLTAAEQLEITAQDEDELLGDVVKLVYARLPYVTLRKVEAAARHGVARLRLHVEAENQTLLEELADELARISHRQVVEVRRLRLPPSELEMADSLSGRTAYNPYSRLPVAEQSMFFGRTRELERVVDWLRAGAGNIWLLGQKRVGKTSLLFHLKHHFLPEWGYVAAFVDFQLLGNLAGGNLCYEIAAAVFADLQGDARVEEAGGPLTAPLRALFDLQPAVELIAYLRSISSRIPGATGRPRLVLLLDEFSRTTDAYLQGQMDRSFFELWRGVMQATVPHIGYITVVQQQTYNAVSRRAQQNLDDPSWHIMELGEKLVLRPLDDDAVRRLIEWPMRNFMEFSPESVAYVAALTGGNPFLIQAFCFKLAAHMAYQDRRRVERDDIEAVRMEFMSPTESVFAHFLDMLRGIGNQVSQTLAILAEEQAAARSAAGLDASGQLVAPAVSMAGRQVHDESCVVQWSALCAALPTLPEPALRRILQEMVTCDILWEVRPDTWAFTSRLLQQWLALHAE